MIEKINSHYINLVKNTEEEEYLKSMFLKIFIRLQKDRLFIRDVPMNGMAKFFGVNRNEFIKIIQYNTGLTFKQLIQLMRSLDTLAMVKRLEGYGLTQQQVSRVSNSSYKQTSEMIKVLTGLSLKNYINGQRKTKYLYFKEERKKELVNKRNKEQSDNTAFLEVLNSL